MPEPDLSKAAVTPVSAENTGSTERSGEDKPAKTAKILADADQRDDDASARDIVSEELAEAADFKAFMHSGREYPGHGERRAAAHDRAHSKSDREASAKDRQELADHDE